MRIHPCKEAVSNKACEFKRGNPAGIEIDFHACKYYYFSIFLGMFFTVLYVFNGRF